MPNILLNFSLSIFHYLYLNRFTERFIGSYCEESDKYSAEYIKLFNSDNDLSFNEIFDLLRQDQFTSLCIKQIHILTIKLNIS